MEETQLESKRIPVMERYKKDPKLLEEQKRALIKYDMYNIARGLTIPSRFSYMKSLRLLGLAIKKPYENMDFDDLVKYYSIVKKWDTKRQVFSDESISKETLWGYQTAHTIFFEWLGNPKLKSEIKRIRVKKSKNGRARREDILTPSEIKQLIEGCIYKRDKVLVSLLYEANARRGEIIGLKVKDVTFDEYGALIKVRKGKTEYSERNIPIIDSAPLLRDYMENYHPLKHDREAYLFLNVKDQSYRGVVGYKRLGIDNTLRILKEAAKRVGIKKNVYPHLLRHSRTTNLLIEGVPMPIIQQLGGWADIQQLSQRYGHVNSEDARVFFLKQRGLIEVEKSRDSSLDVKVCTRCEEKNESTNDYCKKCWLPLNMKVAIKEREAEKEIKSVFEFALKNPEMSFMEIMDKFRNQ